MALIHPVQSVVGFNGGEIVYVVVKNMIVMYRVLYGDYQMVGQWVDEHIDTVSPLSKKPAKKSKNNAGNAVEKTSAKGGPVIPSNIRAVTVFDSGKKLAACTDSDKAVVIFEVDLNGVENCLKLVKRQPFPKRPNAITIDEDGKTLLMADKFGDVYSMSIDSEVTDAINEESSPILGHVSMLTDIKFVKGTNDKKYLITADRDEHIKISHYPESYVVSKWLFGHKEFVCNVSIPAWKPKWLASAGGDDSVLLWNWMKGVKIGEFNYKELITPYLSDLHLAAARFQNANNDSIEYAVAKIVALPHIPYLAFFVEATNLLVILKVSQDGELSQAQTIELPFNVIALCEDENKLLVALDNRSSNNRDFVELISFDENTQKFAIESTESRSINSAISFSLVDNHVAITEVDSIYPLYNTISLKKHGEHFS
ncbi:Trm82p KNAG_0A04990 [Huiozyma naganishii CBS 8797]|uniref:Uncharacterized protein n=1 Tax=Huiozyma naganishii (strain ATCC MYA-139 / BCRC 22969 / CBS 8797 / KCTC 17520 / NBRC 10181 / NCYC 3082 / Yp74L-3) TaxID=1071383 RepID=J7RTS7_HUIN7|nr:hypothetical protein KNAG_0A04990 [Kazachstania naganishii CBS 8797]CCK68167.1 hypothetical protein KNAG_0A04990 [Kazachstania naganishii CBS 8797]